MCEVLKNDNLSNICLGKEFIKHHNDRGNEKSRNCLDSFKCVDISVNEIQLDMFDRELIEMRIVKSAVEKMHRFYSFKKVHPKVRNHGEGPN